MNTGHFCKICGKYKTNEKFSSEGHKAHICKECARLPAETLNKMQTINRLIALPLQLSEEERSWLEKMRNDESPEVRFTAEWEWKIRFTLEDSPEPADTNHY